MATVVELSARYANFLVHPLLPGPGVCQVCRGPANTGHVEQARLRRFSWDVCPVRFWAHR